MGRPNKLHQLAEARGVTPEWYIDWVVVPMVNTHGQAEAARKLHVSQGTVSSWLKEHYVLQPMWLKKMPPKDKASIDRVVARHREQQEQEEMS